MGIKKADEFSLAAFLRDMDDGVCYVSFIRVHEAHHFSKRVYDCRSVVAGFCIIVAIRLKVIEKGEDQIRGQMLDSKRVDFYVIIVCGEGKKERKGISIGFNGLYTAAFNV